MLAATVLGSAMAFIDGTVVHIGLPAIQRSLDADFLALQWVVNAYTLMMGALILQGGGLGDRLGRRRIFIIGVISFAIASIACGLAPDAMSLIIARGFQGIAAAMLVPQSLAILSASFPKEVRGKAIGTWAAAAAITTAAGPVLGGALIDALSWRAIFWLNVPIALLTLWLTLTYVPESRDPDAGGALDLKGAVLAILGLGALTFGLTVAGSKGLGAPEVYIALIAGLSFMGLFIMVEARIERPMMPLDLFAIKAFAGANLLTVLLYFALGGVLFLLPFNLLQFQGYSASAAGAALLPFGIVMGLLSSQAGKLADRFGAMPLLVAGPLLVAVACFGLALPGIGGSYWSTYFLPIVLLAFGMTISVAPLTTTVMNAAPDKDAGIASGINNAVSRIAALLAVTVIGAVVAGIFALDLEAKLEELPLAPDIKQDLLARAAEFGDLKLPEGLEPSMAAVLEEGIAIAFLDGFRVAMIVAAIAALFAAMIAYATTEAASKMEKA